MPPEVAAKLESDKCYGIWWYNRERVVTKQVAETGPGGKHYKKRRFFTKKPRAEWITVPVPDAGIPRKWVDAAREAIKDNRLLSSAGYRFWELSGGVLRCGGCGYSMMTNSVSSPDKTRLNHYYRCSKRLKDGKDACAQRKNYRADTAEPQVWELVSSILQNPKQLRADLERMIEVEREGMRGDPDRGAKTWLEKLAEVSRMRSGYQEMAAKGLITFEELEEKLQDLEETRNTAERELEMLRSHWERGKDVIVETYASMAPEALANLTPEERHRVYEILKLRVVAQLDGTLEVNGALAENLGISNLEPTPQTHSPTTVVPRSSTPLAAPTTSATSIATQTTRAIG